MKAKFWVACFFIVFAMIFMALNARSAEGWGGHTLTAFNKKAEPTLMSGLFCNKLEQIKWAKEELFKGVPLVVIYSVVNSKSQECVWVDETTTVRRIFSSVKIVEKEMGTPITFYYEGDCIGIVYSQAKFDLFDSPVKQYFMTFDTPLTPGDEGDGA